MHYQRYGTRTPAPIRATPIHNKAYHRCCHNMEDTASAALCQHVPITGLIKMWLLVESIMVPMSRNKDAPDYFLLLREISQARNHPPEFGGREKSSRATKGALENTNEHLRRRLWSDPFIIHVHKKNVFQISCSEPPTISH